MLFIDIWGADIPSTPSKSLQKECYAFLMIQGHYYMYILERWDRKFVPYLYFQGFFLPSALIPEEMTSSKEQI